LFPAFRTLWPHTLAGIVVLAALAATRPVAIPYEAFLAAGLALSIPFCIVTAWPRVGAFCVRIGIGRLPEEIAPPAALRALALPAVETAAPMSLSPV
jgi:membrane glycosyltransferase